MFNGFWDVFCFVWLLALVGNLTIFFVVRHEVKKYVKELESKGYKSKKDQRKSSKIFVYRTYLMYAIPVFNVFCLLVLLLCFEYFNDQVYEQIDKIYNVEDDD